MSTPSRWRPCSSSRRRSLGYGRSSGICRESMPRGKGPAARPESASEHWYVEVSMKRATVAGVVAGILALSAPGIAADRTDGFPDGGKLVYGEYGRPATLDPITTNDMVGLRLTELLFNGLVSFSPKNEVVPDLAAKWSVSPDNRVYTFSLRNNVKWHSKAGAGDRTVTADEVV